MNYYKKLLKTYVTIASLFVIAIGSVFLLGYRYIAVQQQTRSNEAVFKTKMSQISEEYNIYKTGQILEAAMQGTEAQVINAGETLKQIIQNEEYEIDVEEDSVLNIKQMLESVRSYRRRIHNNL